MSKYSRAKARANHYNITTWMWGRASNDSSDTVITRSQMQRRGGSNSCGCQSPPQERGGDHESP